MGKTSPQRDRHVSESRKPGILLFGFLLLTSCNPTVNVPLPTLRALAAVPAVPANVLLPATYTPLPDSSATTSAIAFPTAVPSPSPIDVSIPTATTLPTEAPTPRYRASTLAPYFEIPPDKVPCTGTGVLLRSRFYSGTTGYWRSYHAYLPDCYGQDGRIYPVLYLFHGSIQTDSQWIDLGLKEILDREMGSGRFPPFIVIMPFNGEIGNITSGGPRSVEGMTVDALIPHVDNQYCTADYGKGRSIGGISRGGYWALMIAFRHPELFSAVSGHSSHLRLETDAAHYNPLATYSQADLSGLRIWLDWGESDFLRQGQEQLNALLAAAGVAHETHINPGGHSDEYWLAHINQYLAWHAAGWSRDRAVYVNCTL